MCGIAGILRLSGETDNGGENKSERIISLLKHRGPDAHGEYRHQNVTLYHTRLQIIDTTSASSQPYRYTGQQDALVFNGEIFNYRELREKLPETSTSGDVEVLYRLVREQGEAALPLLNGFFAFAYYRPDGTLLLARDRYGVKPLYYFRNREHFIFASELKPLLEIAGPQQLNPNQLYTYFRLNYCSGRETIFSNIYRLLPGELLEVSSDKTERRQWYRIKKEPAKGSLYEVLDDAVRLRLRADVPCGSFLSGGLDSSIISALAIQHKPDLKTFSIGFSDTPYLDESRFAQVAADHIGSDHHAVHLSEYDFLSQVDGFLEAVDEPFADSSAFNVYMLARYCRQHIRVALSGDGADELFKGYRKHRAFLLSDLTGSRQIGALLSGLFSGAGSSRGGPLGNTKRQVEKFAVLSSLPQSEKIKFLASISSHRECTSLLHDGVASMYFDALFTESPLVPEHGAEDSFDLQHVLSDDMLVKADRFTMRHALEVRNPFLDHRVVEHAINLPLSQKIRGRSQKLALRRTFGHLLPRQILDRSKKGFELPLEKWLKKELWQRVNNDWLQAERIASEKIFSGEQVARLKAQLLSSSPGDAPAKIWALVVFQQWLSSYGKYILQPGEKT